MGEGVFVRRDDEVRYGIIREFVEGRISREEAARSLGVTERSVSNLAGKVRQQGLLGIVHGNRGRIPSNKKDAFTKAKALRLKRDKYYDFNVTHAVEKLNEDEHVNVSYSTLLRWCRTAGLLKFRQRRRRKGRKLRERYPREGFFMMMDGSPHRWFGEENSCLISIIDDATSDVPVAEFWPTETTLGCLSVLRKLVKKKGVPEFIYTDRAGIYGGGKRQEFSQFERACKEMGIKVIYANSPEAKGRIERSYRTFQDRLVAEMRLAGVDSYSKANAFIETYLASAWSEKFTHPAMDPQVAYKTLPLGMDANDICCVKIDREIKKNSTISLDGAIYILEPKAGDPIITSRIAEVRTYPDNTWAIFCENRRVLLRVAPANHQPDHRYRQKIRPGNKDLSWDFQEFRKTG